MTKDVYREAFMAPITEVLEEASRLASFLNAQAASAYRARVRGVQASVKLLVDGNVVVRDDVSPELAEAQRQLAAERAINEGWRTKITEANRANNSGLAKYQARITELEAQLAEREPNNRQLNKLNSRLRLARELVADLREVVVPLHQQVKRTREVARDILNEAEGLEGIDIRKLLRVSRLLVNEADGARDPGVRAKEAEELDGLMAGGPFKVTRR